ncbi:hypothetical protein [Stenotrophomonas sp. B1-1]|uniref:InvB/SpaK family type III secretion system chaperone n=1 Tax=Stenotrophomonas sp. B1-1 TaxID=2710648 RepID=UPI0013DC81E7|nr:hypothetical protein [Stenotrophomonas sp. B1-1]
MINLSKTLHDALIRLGCDRETLDFDDRSDIVLNFTDIGELFIVPDVGDKVWLWGLVREMEVRDLGARAASFLEQLLTPASYMASGALGARSCDQGLQIGGLFDPRCLGDSEVLGNALVDFHSRMQQLLESLR